MIKNFDSIKLRILAFFILSMLFLIPLIKGIGIVFKFKTFAKETNNGKSLYITIILICFVRFLCFGFVCDMLYDELCNHEKAFMQLEHQ